VVSPVAAYPAMAIMTTISNNKPRFFIKPP
jgi:hypothetical protein